VLYNDFNRAVKAKYDLGCPKDEDSDLVVNFLGKLPCAYAAMRAEWSNHRRIWGATFPYLKTIVEAYERAAGINVWGDRDTAQSIRKGKRIIILGGNGQSITILRCDALGFKKWAYIEVHPIFCP
jgi:hypothetical protein